MEHDNGITNFHFEIAADILNEEELELLEQMRPGLVQLEIVYSQQIRRRSKRSTELWTLKKYLKS